MTAADRPSVTDNARAEAERKAREEHWCGDPAVFVAGAEWAAGRAETTTATTEDDPYLVERHIAHVEAAVEDYRNVYPAPHALSPNLDLAVRGARLLATARTRPAEGTRWWVPAYRTPNSRVQRIGSPTVLREYAEREVEQYRAQEAEDPEGNPAAIFLATRVEYPWTEVDQ